MTIYVFEMCSEEYFEESLINSKGKTKTNDFMIILIRFKIQIYWIFLFLNIYH